MFGSENNISWYKRTPLNLRQPPLLFHINCTEAPILFTTHNHHWVKYEPDCFAYPPLSNIKLSTTHDAQIHQILHISESQSKLSNWGECTPSKPSMDCWRAGLTARRLWVWHLSLKSTRSCLQKNQFDCREDIQPYYLVSTLERVTEAVCQKLSPWLKSQSIPPTAIKFTQ